MSIHKVSFPLVPQLLNHLLHEATVCRVMMLHDTCTSGTSQVLTVALLQRFKMEALISAPGDCEVRSAMKFLNALSIAPIEICQQAGGASLVQIVYTRSTTCAWWGVHWEASIITYDLVREPHAQWFPTFLTTQEILVRSAFSEWQRGGDECHTMVPMPGGKLLRHRDTKVGPTVWQISQFWRRICWKIAQHLLYLFQ